MVGDEIGKQDFSLSSMNNVFGEIGGYIAGAGTTLAFLPQVIKSISTRNVSGLSLFMYIIYCIGLISWIFYGIYLDSFQIILFNCITLVLNTIILYLIIVNTRSKKKRK